MSRLAAVRSSMRQSRSIRRQNGILSHDSFAMQKGNIMILRQKPEHTCAHLAQPNVLCNPRARQPGTSHSSFSSLSMTISIQFCPSTSPIRSSTALPARPHRCHFAHGHAARSKVRREAGQSAVLTSSQFPWLQHLTVAFAAHLRIVAAAPSLPAHSRANPILSKIIQPSYTISA